MTAHVCMHECASFDVIPKAFGRTLIRLTAFISACASLCLYILPCLDRWRNEQHELRLHADYKLTGVPTMLLQGSQTRLAEAQLRDLALVKTLFTASHSVVDQRKPSIVQVKLGIRIAPRLEEG